MENGVKVSHDSEAHSDEEETIVGKPRAKNDAADLAVGARLKAVREQAGLSQRELAKRAGVTNSTVSLIEADSHAPSLASLHRILNAIPISIADFFALPVSKQNVMVYDAPDLAVVSRGKVDMRVLGGERRDKKLQMFIEQYSPGTDTGKVAIKHDGETAAYILEGVVELETEEGVRRIEAGGGFQIFGSQPYRLKNVGKTIAVVACAVTPPMI
ncbi:helix-turn-helix domain-containing protein [Agrobacterium tumefaciens]|uniref:helix-turn-helix domain-containing protein n=1 Tax=Agrobacterium tumefaciens TaxID=358 RepID=UPI00157259C8|nr:helix-turn-helix domain-containing protein [Agrobacterium tumefaciens]NSZ02076.1 helix-turn-helix domain-containing protein [Agrobacterium tumefaciens]NTB05703.1 helix-turn-helix domain-containing protein [Agrobacterium tumefaciens]NTB21802.1 helix-turn-helix domain-containing protein [Agrobacterium tumefaciens]NTB29548.1 helix-turn-helix domain-containing protein [Agrobacterium tumefaciens]NTB34528.1 helix-turn-helix domain-containing protein [Agrobacterium tumefaciens]